MKKIRLNILVYLILFMPITIFIYLLIIYSSNKPVADDFHSVLMYLNNYEDLKNIGKQFLYLFHPHNEYKLVFSNLVQIVILKTTGQINFISLIFTGFFGLLLIFIFLFKFFRELNLPIVYFIPIPFLLFNLVQYDLTFWAMASMQAYYQYLFVILAMYFLYKNKIVLFILFTVFSMFQGGMWLPLTFVVLAKFLINKSYRNFVITSIIVLITFIFMKYTGMNKLGHDIVENMLQVIDILKFSLGVIGSVFNTYQLAVFLAIILVSFFIYSVLFFRFSILNKSFSFNMIMIFFVSVPALAINRVHTGIDASLSSRYSLISIFLIIFIYLFILENYNSRYLKNILIIFSSISIVLYMYNFKFIDNIKNRQNYVETTVYPFFNEEHGKPILNESLKKKIYSYNTPQKLDSGI